jgi:uncharacterized protein involved in exopolysaccharide biosynthesis
VTGFDQFQVRFDHADAAVAAEVANELANAYVDAQRGLRETDGEKTTEVMSHEIALLARKLSEQSEQIKQFRIRNQGSLPGQTDGNLRAIERWQGDLRLNTQALQRAKQRLALALANTPKIYQGEAIESLRADVTGLTAEREEITALIQDAEEKVARAAEVEGTLAAMQREHDSTLRTYNDMIERRSAASLRAQLDRTRLDSLVHVAEAAKAPLSPFRPARLLILGVALLFGVLAGSALAIAADWFDDTFHDAPALARVTGLPVLAAVPKSRRLTARAGGTVGH